MTERSRRHLDAWDRDFPQSNIRIDYREATAKLQLPVVDAHFEDIEAIFTATPKTTIDNTFTCEITTSPEKNDEYDRLTIQETKTGTWRDYLTEEETLNRWLKRTSIGRSPYRIHVIDTTHPLAVLAARNTSITRDAIVIAITADESSTPMEKNTSYAALRAIHGWKASLILATREYADNLTLYHEDVGLMKGRPALNQLISDYIDNIKTISRHVERDRSFGIENHAISTTTSANERVYKDVDAAIQTIERNRSTQFSDDDVLSIQLQASSHWRRFTEIERAYKRLLSRFKNLIDAEISLREKDTRHELYDINTIYGLKRDPILSHIKTGYEAVAKQAPRLKTEEHR